MGPHPAVAQARACVRRCLGDLEPGDLVLAACSGGADSLALAAALAHEAPRLGLRGGGVTVDHGLQEGSAAQASRVVARPGRPGARPGAAGPGDRGRAARGRRPGSRGAPAPGTPRWSRWRDQTGAAAVLLGHTRDDQAETVLLGLARGSGARALAGMPARRGRFRRPLLGLGRATLREACLAQRLEPVGRPAQLRPVLRPGPGPPPGPARAGGGARPGDRRGAGPQRGPAERGLRGAGRHRPRRGVADPAGARRTPGSAAPAGDGAGRDGATILSVADTEGLAALAPAIRTRVLRQAALLAGLPGRLADRRPRRRPGRAGDRVARPARGRPARGRPGAAAVWEAAVQ